MGGKGTMRVGESKKQKQISGEVLKMVYRGTLGQWTLCGLSPLVFLNKPSAGGLGSLLGTGTGGSQAKV